MHPAIRTPIDGLNDIVSLETALSCPLSEDRTRQEFKSEADINVLLRRYGAVPGGRVPLYGEQNYDDGLMEAYISMQTAQDTFNGLPEDIRRAYPTWQHLARAIEFERNNPVAATPEVPSGVVETAPSVSAAVK
ncbi:MAG: internal scaffolding protein [Microvirus sp.]|nr:MAG: internal scaffolding protein [Microvirus sp.]